MFQRCGHGIEFSRQRGYFCGALGVERMKLLADGGDGGLGPAQSFLKRGRLPRVLSAQHLHGFIARFPRNLSQPSPQRPFTLARPRPRIEHVKIQKLHAFAGECKIAPTSNGAPVSHA